MITKAKRKEIGFALVPVLIVGAIIAVLLFFAPMPYFVEGEIRCIQAEGCPRSGWNLGSSLYERLKFQLFSDNETNSTVTPTSDVAKKPEPTRIDSSSSQNDILVTPKVQSADGRFCGGIAANLPVNQCPKGYTCKLDENYPDAGGKCVKPLW